MMDAREVAGKLSEQMISALTWPSEINGQVWIVPRTLYPQTINALLRRGLITGDYRLTPLGLAVRALAEEPR